MQYSTHYSSGDSMAGLISENYNLIHVMTRFGIKIGFGDKSIDDVCKESMVDTNTFLAVVNFVLDGFNSFDSSMPLSLPSLILYLKRSHTYFLDFSLPAIRRKLLDGIRLRTTDVSFLIMKFFDEYYSEVRKHMEYEEETVFGYVDKLLAGILPDGFKIATYSDHHEQAADKLGELKKILLRYCPSDAEASLINDALFRICECEKELENHCRVEDVLLVPEIKRLEKTIANA